MKLKKQVTVCGGAIFCVAVFSLYLMLDRVQHDPARRQSGGNFPRVRVLKDVKRCPLFFHVWICPMYVFAVLSRVFCKAFGVLSWIYVNQFTVHIELKNWRSLLLIVKPKSFF